MLWGVQADSQQETAVAMVSLLLTEFLRGASEWSIGVVSLVSPRNFIVREQEKF